VVRIAIDQSDGLWAPYVSPAEAMKLDEVRLALRKNDTETAAKYEKVYQCLPDCRMNQRRNSGTAIQVRVAPRLISVLKVEEC